MESLTLSDKHLPRVSVQASVIFTILNGYSRRSIKDSRLIGTLLGEVKENHVAVTECFVVPFTEKSDESGQQFVAINKDYHKQMYHFHRRMNKKEAIVGWFATTSPSGALLVDNSSLAHEFYSEEVANPIHLVVDTTLTNDTLQVHGFVSKPLLLNKEILGDAFQEIKVNVVLNDFETSLLANFRNAQYDRSTVSVPLDADHQRRKVKDALEKLLQLLDKMQLYVNKVIEGKIEGNREVGVALSDALTACIAQQLSPSQLQSLQTRYDDLLMVQYLTSLVQTQLQVSEKLSQIL